jgi:thiosulfate reductase cytochrome b subunit
VVFTLIHVFEVIVAGVWNEIRSMVTGWYTLPAARGKEARP